MRLLHFFATSRSRLAIGAAVLFTAVFGAGPAIADYVRVDSSSVGENILIMTSWLFVALIGCLLLGILLGDIFLPWHWRRRVILGEIIPPPPDAIGTDAVKATKAYMVPFSCFVVGLLILSGYALELVTDNFFAEYQREGYFRTVLRSDDDGAKLRLVEEKSDVQLPDHVRVTVGQLDGIWRDQGQPNVVRVAAVDALAAIGRSLTTSVASWKAHGRAASRWEAEVLAEMRRDIGPSLVQHIGEVPDELGDAALLAVGMMQEPNELARFHALIKAAPVGSERWMIAVSSLGFMANRRSLKPLVAAVPRVKDAKALSFLSWAIARISKSYPIDPEEPAPAIFTRLVQAYGDVLAKGEPLQRCAAAHVLRYVGDADIATHLFAAFDAATDADQCKTFKIVLRKSKPVFVGSEEKLRMVVLYAFRRIGKGHKEVWEWAAARAEDRDLGATMQGHLQNLAVSARGR